MALAKVISSCGFCNTGTHASCVIGTVMRRSSKYPEGVVWQCKCPDAVCMAIREASPVKCTECGNRNTSEVDRDTWLCIDTADCNAVVTARRDSDPLLANIRKAKEMAKITEDKAKTEKAKAAPKTGTCQCGCAGTTKGGKFLPGHDARFVSTLVTTVEDAGFTKASMASARKSLKDAGASDALQAKFEKSAGLAVERKEKKEADAKAKADAKAEKAKA